MEIKTGLSAAIHFEPTREAALAQLHAFLPNAGTNYARTRNFDFGPGDRDNVSCLSPWVRHRLISEEEILKATLGAHRFSTAEKFIQEVFWRGYFKGWLEHSPSVWTAYRRDVDQLTAQFDGTPVLSKQLSNAEAGQTGIDCFDFWTRELVETGYLHNHARMWFASIWIFTLELPWQLGADFFYRHLIDGDAASNTLSWRWVAGLHTKGKTYLARASNIAQYTNDRFEPEGLAPQAPALEEANLHPKQRPDLLAAPTPAEGRVGLLLTDEELTFDPTGEYQNISTVMGICLADRRSPRPTGHTAAAFSQSAVSGATALLSTTLGLAEPPAITNDTAEIVAWAKESSLSTVLTPYACTGPARELLTRLQDDLEQIGVKLSIKISDYDRLTWPHTSKGFFALKKKIPSILSELGLT
ncbi:MAG: FAD-binding domain-containing protein [Pseudomonadota bacterium]